MVPVTADTIARYLTENGLPIGEHNGQINTMRMYLAQAGVFPSSRASAWTINRQRVNELLGINSELMRVLSAFEPLQREFTLALCRLNPTAWVKAAEVRDYAEAISDQGTRFPRGNTRTYIEPLEKAGLIEFASGGTASGKSIRLRTTSSFNREILEPFFRATATNLNLDATTTQYFRMQPKDIFADLSSSDKYRKGVALEALAVYVMRLLGLRLRGWRKRAAETGGAEIDALMAGILGTVTTKWQVQCKNHAWQCRPLGRYRQRGWASGANRGNTLAIPYNRQVHARRFEVCLSYYANFEPKHLPDGQQGCRPSSREP